MDYQGPPEPGARATSRRNDLTVLIGPGSRRCSPCTLLAAVGITAMFVWPLHDDLLILSGHAARRLVLGHDRRAHARLLAELYTLAVHESAGDRRYAERLRLPG